jgi:hypothetical protein
MPDKFDPDEKFKVDIGDEEPEDALRRLLDKKKAEPEADPEDED